MENNDIYEMGGEFIWWVGQVVSRDDPLAIGRVRVRIPNDHGTPDEIADDDLPWARIMMPANKASTLVEGGNAVGQSPVGVINGSVVMGFYADGREKQLPIVMGSLPGAPLSVDVSGDTNPFTTPTDMPFEAKGIKTALDTPIGFEPPFALLGATGSAYPYNKVEVTESGHIMEFDDTPGRERIAIRHRSGAYMHFDVNGDKVDKTPTNKWDIVGKNRLDYIGENWVMFANGSLVLSAEGSILMQATESISISAGKFLTISSGYTMSISAPLVLIN